MRIKATIIFWFIRRWTWSVAPLPYPFRTPCANLRKIGQRLYFKAPSIVVGKVPVQYIEFVSYDVVDKFFDFVFGEEVTAHIEHGSAPSEARLICNGYC